MIPPDQIATGRARYAGDECPAYRDGDFVIDPSAANAVEVRGFECIAAFMRNGPCMTSSTAAELAVQCEPLVR
jgi:hypothetical protein